MSKSTWNYISLLILIAVCTFLLLHAIEQWGECVLQALTEAHREAHADKVAIQAALEKLYDKPEWRERENE